MRTVRKFPERGEAADGVSAEFRVSDKNADCFIDLYTNTDELARLVLEEVLRRKPELQEHVGDYTKFHIKLVASTY